ncbi:MAG: hypothetical protein GX442_07915 [Candidatus Riflebacteria bacterium]|nr:hypothetical protein [Candidatus Riflebacteria bacterium]
MFRNRGQLRLTSLLTVLFFVLSTLGAYAETVTPVSSAQNVDLAGLFGSNPTVGLLNGNISTLENSLQQIQQTAAPLYSKLAPSNMETMSIAERVKAIVGNTKDMVKMGAETYKGQVNEWNAAHGITPDTTFEGELGVGLNELGVQAGQLPLGGKGDVAVGKLKGIIEAIKAKLGAIINMIKAKLVALAQKIGLLKKKTTDESKGPAKEQEGYAQAPVADVQYADTFAGKLAKGVSEGTQNAKQSLKNSFSFTNLAVTTTVAVGTNLAIDMINGERPSLGKAVKAVASVEFAGSVVGSALGAAGGQFAGTLVKTFMPGPIGAIAGSLLPVMFGSAAGQMGSSIASDLKRGTFSLSKAWKQIDKVDLVGSSIGSTIGMALGAPIPIIGPIIGGIVGGLIGSKIAKWVTGGFKTGNFNVLNRGTSFTPDIPKSGVTIGEGSGLGIYNGGSIGSGLTPTGDVKQVSGNLQQVEQQYYQTYMQYNKLVEAGKTDEAKKVFNNLKVLSDQYNSLKSQAK